MGGLPNAPVRAVGGCAGKRAFEQRRDLVILDGAGLAGTQLIIESGQAVLNKALPPLADRGIGPAQAVGNLGVALPCRRPEYEFGACHQGMGQSAGSGKTAKLGMLVCSQGEGGLGASCDHVRSLSQARLLMIVIYGTQD